MGGYSARTEYSNEMLRDDQIILAPLREAIGKVPLRAHPDSEVFIALIRLGTIDLLRNGSD